MDPMMGMIFMVPWNWAPLNYNLCQGQTVQVSQYEALYSLMGFTFGGNGSSIFQLPNLQGRTPIGTGTLNTSLYTLGNHGGAQAVNLSQAQLPVHNHGATFLATTGPQVISIPGTTGSLGVTASLPLGTTASGSAIPGAGDNYLNGISGSVSLSATSTKSISLVGPFSSTQPTGASLPVTTTISGTASTPTTNVTITTVTGGNVMVGGAGSSAAVSLIQPYLAMSFIIAMNGLYPDRP